jgi:hypothetical protein
MQRIGFDRMIKLNWIEYYAQISRHEEDMEMLKEQMHKALFDECPRRASRVKNVTVLQRIWTRVDVEYRLLRRDALNILDNIEMPERLALHWGMTLLAYPFFREIAAFCGRFLKLQETFNRHQIKEQITALWGARPTLERALPRVLESMVDWGALSHAGSRGTYQTQPEIPVTYEQLRLWLLRVCVEIESGGISLERATSLPYLFPFSFNISLSEIQQTSCFSITRERNNSIVIDQKSV